MYSFHCWTLTRNDTVLPIKSAQCSYHTRNSHKYISKLRALAISIWQLYFFRKMPIARSKILFEDMLEQKSRIPNEMFAEFLATFIIDRSIVFGVVMS